MTDMRETHPSLKQAENEVKQKLVDMHRLPIINRDILIQKHTRDVAKIREAIEKVSKNLEYNEPAQIQIDWLLKELNIEVEK